MHDRNLPIDIDSALPRLRLGTLKSVFDCLSLESAAVTRLPASLIGAALSSAEKTSPSGVGMGVCLPHLRLQGIPRPFYFLATSQRPVACESIDGRPVDIVMLLMSPYDDGSLHLRRLSRLTRILRDENLCDDLRHATTAEELRLILSPDSTQRIAA